MNTIFTAPKAVRADALGLLLAGHSVRVDRYACSYCERELPGYVVNSEVYGQIAEFLDHVYYDHISPADVLAVSVRIAFAGERTTY